MPGYFITFEGGEGSGKTTLIASLQKTLTARGFSVLKTREPGGTPLGQQIRNLLLHTKAQNMDPRCELFLFLADRSQHVKELILPALQQGKVVLCDRFTDSTLAYQGGARGFDVQTMKQLCSFATAGLQPDLTLYLDLDPTQGFARLKGGKDRIESEALEFHQAIRNQFCQLAQEETERIYQIDASLSPDEVLQHALERIDALLPSHR